MFRYLVEGLDFSRFSETEGTKGMPRRNADRSTVERDDVIVSNQRAYHGLHLADRIRDYTGKRSPPLSD